MQASNLNDLPRVLACTSGVMLNPLMRSSVFLGLRHPKQNKFVSPDENFLRQDSTIWDESDNFEAAADAGSAQPPGGVVDWGLARAFVTRDDAHDGDNAD